MALSRVHNWISLETLTASDLNAEYNNILNYLNSSAVTFTSLAVSGTLSATGATTLTGGQLTVSGNVSAAAWTTLGIRLVASAATYTDTTSSGTVPIVQIDRLGAATIAASSAVTYTNAYGSFFKTPLVGANVTFTNGWAIGAETARITGAFTVDGTTTLNTALGPSSGGKPSNRLYSGVGLVPAATVSATYVMMGMGSTLTLTPTTTGAVRIRVQGHADMGTDTQTVQMKLYYGTGTAPVNGAAFTGTAFSATSINASPGAAGGGVPFSMEYEVTGLTLSTAYWFDMAIVSTSGGSASVVVSGYRIEEF